MPFNLRQTHYLYNPKLNHYASWLRKNSTFSEVLLWQKIKGKQVLGYKFQRQKPIGRYIVDFYCHELKLAIEVDGFTHDDKVEYDLSRQRTLEVEGIRVLRFTDREVRDNLDNVIQGIADWILANAEGGADGRTTPPYPPARGEQ